MIYEVGQFILICFAFGFYATLLGLYCTMQERNLHIQSINGDTRMTSNLWHHEDHPEDHPEDHHQCQYSHFEEIYSGF
jgi:hypothetical protein